MTDRRGTLEPFDPNGYRKRVLAAVDRRGGPDTSDAFELYDVPVDAAAAGTLDDAAVLARIDEVWGFWQRQRDHPKYRVLVAELVATHDARSADLRDPGQRRIAAVAARAVREQRDAARYQLLDAAIARLVDRHGGVPADKVEGLHDVGALAGLDRAEVTARLNRHRLLPATPTPAPAPAAAVGPERRRQIRALLDEFGRLTDGTPPPTLLALLGLGADAGPEEVAERAAGWRARARELPPDRLRVVVDELLVHVADLLEAGPRAIAGYLTAVEADVADVLRPQVRAAVLVEDRLVAEDHAHLVDTGVEAGLDRVAAAALVARLAAELGAEVEPVPGAATPPPRDPAPPPGPDLREVRRALREGRPRAASALLGDVRGLDGAPATQARALAAEIETVVAEAARTWLVLDTARAARRWVEVAALADRLQRTASDVPAPDGRTAADVATEAGGHVAAADRAFARVPAGPPADRVRALRAVLQGCADHVGALAALSEGVPPAAPGWVSAARDAAGAVLVLWEPTVEAGVTHKVERLTPDGSWRVVGRTTDAAIEDGGAPPGVEAPVYRVTSLVDGRTSASTRSDDAPEPVAAHRVLPSDPGPSVVRAERGPGGVVHVSWAGEPTARYRVRRRRPDGGWSVVGRVAGTSIDDGNVPLGNLPVYEVVLVDDGASPGDVAPLACSDG
ncbi:MAG: Ig-like domain repeat protein [Pseudonocardiaceae bacterium]|nr:MAG: Ig-like domain repeat protein [Pseudonocardiaceae bacterium]